MSPQQSPQPAAGALFSTVAQARPVEPCSSATSSSRGDLLLQRLLRRPACPSRRLRLRFAHVGLEPLEALGLLERVEGAIVTSDAAEPAVAVQRGSAESGSPAGQSEARTAPTQGAGPPAAAVGNAPAHAPPSSVGSLPCGR